MKHILVVASTLPASEGDSVPAFVKDQVIALKKLYPDIIFTIVVPHDVRSKTRPLVQHKFYLEYRFHYFWPRRFEKLAGHGIMPTLKQNGAYYLLVPFFILAEFRSLWRITKKTKPDLLYAHWFMPQGITVGLVSLLTGTPFVFTSHSSDVAILKKVPLGKTMVKFFVARARAVSVVSRRSLNKLKLFYTQGQWQSIAPKIAIIPMGTQLAPQARFSHKSSDSINFLFMGRLAEKKGVQYLLPAFKKIALLYPQALLVIAGDGPWFERLKEQAQRLKLTRTKFVGYVTGSTKEKWVRWADIFVVPSIITARGDAEGLPVSLMEGLAAGKVCIASNESGADDIIEDRVHGFLIPQKNELALVEAIKRAINQSDSEQTAMTHAAQQLSKQFAWPTIAQRHWDFLLRAPLGLEK